MKKSGLIMAFLPLFLFVCLTVSGQSKEEKKKLKEQQKKEKAELKLLKKMKPEQIKALKQGFEKKSSDLDVCAAQKDSAISRAQSLETKALLSDSALHKMEAQLKEAKEQQAAEEEGTGAGGGGKQAMAGVVVPKKGILFTVQLGAYRKFDISSKMGKNGMTVQNEEGLVKYLLGSFKTLPEAEAFRKEIQKMGIKDAWVVAFKDGQRIDKDAAAKLQSSSKVEIAE